MSCPLYFIGGVEQSEIFRPEYASPFGIGRELLTNVGLWPIVCDLQGPGKVSISNLQNGSPSGEPGVVFSIGNADHEPDLAGFWPQQQSWKQVSQSVWVGWSSPVLPEHLLRDRSIVDSVEPVTLHDGTLWDVPILREPMVGRSLVPIDQHLCHLPSSWAPQLDSRWGRFVLSEYEALWTKSRTYFELLIQGNFSFDWVEVFQYAIEVLSLRYRICELLYAACPEQWVNTANVWEVVRASTGWHIVERYVQSQKKTEAPAVGT